MSGQGFQVYALDTPRDARTIKQRLEKVRADLAALVAEPNVDKDWDDYQRRVGALEGIDIALRVCDEIVDKEAERGR